ncbi:MAG: S24 family peptidase [Gammaproteobacteria bacterium]|jgi:SOS-response transcriptional repressor LexA
MNTDAAKISSVLKLLLNTARINESALSRAINIPRTTINRLASGKTPDPRASTLQAIAQYFNISVEQLLGNQPINAPNTPSKQIPIISWDAVNTWDAIKQNLSISNHKSWVSSTNLNKAENNFAIKITGDAMWPLFAENTILIIDPDKQPKNRDFVLAYRGKNNETIFRQLIMEGQYKFLTAVNEIFPTVKLQDKDQIIGVLVQAIHDYE